METFFNRNEVVGVVIELGKDVTKFKIGENVGVGCTVGSCRSYGACEDKMEQYSNKRLWTYNDVNPDGKLTQGGFSSTVVVD